MAAARCRPKPTVGQRLDACGERLRQRPSASCVVSGALLVDNFIVCLAHAGFDKLPFGIDASARVSGGSRRARQLGRRRLGLRCQPGAAQYHVDREEEERTLAHDSRFNMRQQFGNTQSFPKHCKRLRLVNQPRESRRTYSTNLAHLCVYLASVPTANIGHSVVRSWRGVARRSNALTLESSKKFRAHSVEKGLAFFDEIGFGAHPLCGDYVRY
mmetsp:Transcript_49364/g.72401  ORF Transcript_49364/g.72401 Transcript_49364/m.72401 type:complete len:214 (-) Transcript_49364:211-852(-)